MNPKNKPNKYINYKISFKERAKIALEQLSKQLPTNLDSARKQASKLKAQSKSILRKK
jgi:hypothetical protein